MDEQSKRMLEKIVAKEVSSLSDADKAFLRARRSYLSPLEEKRFAEVLKDKKQEKQDGEGVAPENNASQNPGQTGAGEVQDQDANPKPYVRMNKGELQKACQERGIVFDGEAKNKDLVALLEAVDKEQGAEK
jgi:hypothetical protein